MPRERWSRGDYLVVEMLEDGPDSYGVETTDGNLLEMFPGDRLIGALGTRAATLEVYRSLVPLRPATLSTTTPPRSPQPRWGTPPPPQPPFQWPWPRIWPRATTK